MKATEAALLPFLKKSPQFMIPIYQRTYSWKRKECRQLWDDILRTGRNDEIPAHFIGSVVYIEKGLYQISNPDALLVIDGQQRLTSVTLLIAALAEILGDTEPLDGFTARKLRHYYLLNPEEAGERYFKLILSQTDKDSLISILKDTEQPMNPSVRVQENYEFFRSWLEELGSELPAICRGLAKLLIVDVALTRDQDNPQLIFESMNSTGKELSQADLIRNYILMGLEPEVQTRLYEQYWRPIELGFGQEAYATHFDKFMRYYLIVKTGEIPNVRDVYEAFKTYARPLQDKVEDLVSSIRSYAGHYCAIALGSESNSKLRQVFQDLRELKVDVAYPFLLELYDDYAQNLLDSAELLRAARYVESYVFRRAVCSIPTNSLNKTFANLGRSLKKDRYLESVEAAFLLLPSYRRFPGNDEFERGLHTRDLYNFRSRGYWLRRVENHGRKEHVPVDEYTIEHILPQNEDLSEAWRTELGPDWERVQKTWLHTLGNLTLTGYNSEYSDKPFCDKRDMDGGFRESPLRVNQGLGHLERWDEDAIHQRAAKLAGRVVQVWPSPALDEEVLDAYRQKPATSSSYTIDDHPYLDTGTIREVFEAFRKQVLALDFCVVEEFWKLYVAYKAETNFVDVVPQARRLRLSLNMPFPEIRDPRGMCKDVSGLGRWGNGDVEAGLSSMDDLPYVMGLVRQSFERQMGENGTT